MLDKDEYSMFYIGYSGTRGNLNANAVNESGLYSLILRSNKPEARKFRKWVTSEVLPSIRKTGQYVMRITPEQKGELQRMIAQRFPEGKHRPYAWSRFNNHFGIASYKDLPQRRFSEAVEYIKTMPLKSEDEYGLVMLPFQSTHLRGGATADGYYTSIRDLVFRPSIRRGFFVVFV